MDEEKSKNAKDRATEEASKQPSGEAEQQTAQSGTEAENQPNEEQNPEKEAQTGDGENVSRKDIKKLKAELEKTNKELEKAKDENKEQNDRYLRMIAEYDNFRKRAAKEREGVYADAYSDLLIQILPVLDNLERAEAACKPSEAEGSEIPPDIAKISEGIALTLKSFRDALAKIGVEEIEAQGKPFDPSFHNAVMHVESDEHDEATVVDVFQKGYKKGDKVIRYAMVKVAN